MLDIPAPELAIATENLSKQFDRHLAVDNVDLRIGYGEVYGLIGPNGAGKTTLIRMLAAIEGPTTGVIYFHGERLDPSRPNPRLKRYLGYLPDDFPLYDDLTVWDYLDYFARLYELREPRRSRRLLEILDLVQLIPKRDSLISTLSRGMKQRLSLGRTILHEPILLLLDEPVSGLDPIARQQFREIIQVVREAGMTVLISSHVLSDLAQLCTSIGIMELGCLVESTAIQELYRRLSQQRLLISLIQEDLAQNVERAIAELRNCPQVESWTVSDRQITVQFQGDETESANLLQQLIQSQVKLCQFQLQQDDLEDIFLKLGHQQTS
ncbi:MAG: ABC transporter ATP-binding protein [Phormidium sp. BM_Day4_Bin.17]|nr:ABC transporter ATP-binding protein [Phormidium sp. BM_Day4_Bin.17]UCJ14202.1 MAG: ABC transporter ATP-binding protein [Phormidium sp. PBR-2020]